MARTHVFVCKDDGSFKHLRHQSWLRLLGGDPSLFQHYASGQQFLVLERSSTQTSGSAEATSCMVNVSCWELPAAVGPALQLKTLKPFQVKTSQTPAMILQGRQGCALNSAADLHMASYIDELLAEGFASCATVVRVA